MTQTRMAAIPDLKIKPLKCTLCRGVQGRHGTSSRAWRVFPTPGKTSPDAVLCPDCDEPNGAADRDAINRALDEWRPAPVEMAALISGDERHRYVLSRTWSPTDGQLVWIMLNPSTADASHDDATIRVCCARSRRLGKGGIAVVNLFAFRATDPSVLRRAHAEWLCDGTKGQAPLDLVGPDNDRHLVAITAAARDRGDVVVCAWGNDGELWGRGWRVRELLEQLEVPLHRIALTKLEQPCHPLRQSLDAPLVPWVRS